MQGEKQTMPPSSSRDAADLISGLDDDLLLHVLCFMPEARDVARTSALSRRWRDISTRAPVLHFCVGQGGGSTTKKSSAL
uniref:F-box domain-containing protein n=1 Tax=Aegilops tauschii TaxID=37682 RepID=M8BAC0_AEGTA